MPRPWRQYPYTLSVTIDLVNARDWNGRPDAPCAGFPSELATRSYRAEIKELPRPGYFTHFVSAEDPTLRSHDLFALYTSGSYVGFETEESGINEDLSGFRYLEIGGSSDTKPAVRNGASVSIPFIGGVSYCQ